VTLRRQKKLFFHILTYPQAQVSSVLKIKFFAQILCQNFLEFYFSPLKGKDPAPGRNHTSD
jgi:hypothetical protein